MSSLLFIEPAVPQWPRCGSCFPIIAAYRRPVSFVPGMCRLKAAVAIRVSDFAHICMDPPQNVFRTGVRCDLQGVVDMPVAKGSAFHRRSVRPEGKGGSFHYQAGSPRYENGTKRPKPSMHSQYIILPYSLAKSNRFSFVSSDADCIGINMKSRAAAPPGLKYQIFSCDFMNTSAALSLQPPRPDPQAGSRPLLWEAGI